MPTSTHSHLLTTFKILTVRNEYQYPVKKLFNFIKIWDAIKDISDKKIVYFIANKLGSTIQPV